MIYFQFSLDVRSILGVGDITEVVSDKEADMASLSTKLGTSWTSVENKVSTSCWNCPYQLARICEERKMEDSKPFLLEHINNVVVHIYCHKVPLEE